MKFVRWILIALVVFLVVAQVYRPEMTNPPVDPSQSLEAAVHPPADVANALGRSCRDCHSNQTEWPLYAKIAPMSWLLADHVKEGRQELNFSEWATFQPRRQARKLQEIAEQVREGEMPIQSYLLLHPAARLSDAERQAIVRWADSERAKVIAAHPEAAQKGNGGAPAGARPEGEREGEGER